MLMHNSYIQGTNIVTVMIYPIVFISSSNVHAVTHRIYGQLQKLIFRVRRQVKPCHDKAEDNKKRKDDS